MKLPSLTSASLSRASLSRLSPARDPQLAVRVLLGALLLANLVAAYTVFYPVGGSVEELEAQLVNLRGQLQQRQESVRQLRSLTTKVESARTQGDTFLQGYFLDRRTAASSIVGELEALAKKANIKAKEKTFAFEPIEGSDTLTNMTISAAYEGSYADLLALVNAIDRSPRFLIIETLNAVPTQTPGRLNVLMRLHTFVRQESAA